MNEMKRKNLINYVFLGCVIILFLWSLFSIQMNGIKETSWDVTKSIFSGIFHPDFAFVYDGSGEDLLGLLLLTIGIGFLGTMISIVGAIPLAFLSAANMWKYPIFAKIGKFFLTVIRVFPEMVLAIIFVKMVGPGAFAGVLAIGFHSIGMLGKLYAEAIEKIDKGPVEAMQAVGANWWQILFYAYLPQIIPAFLSLGLNRFEISVRSATILGVVGAGGIGTPMLFAIAARGWNRVGIILLGIMVTITLIDWLSGLLRKKLQ